MRVKVYRNLHKSGYTYSILSVETGKVIGYNDDIVLQDVVFKVSQKGRLRVLKSNRKNVHAFIEGNLSDRSQISHSGRRIIYNPKLYDSFVLSNNTNYKLKTAGKVSINKKSIRAININK